jgi:DNA transformation protein
VPSARQDYDHIRELFAAFGAVEVRRMFGGAGIFADGVMIGLIADDVIHLKADEATQEAFRREGCEPFGYQTSKGRRQLTSYWRLPERLYDDPDELAGWARTALAVAMRGAAAKAPARKRATKPKARKKA